MIAALKLIAAQKRDIQTRIEPNQGIKKSANNMVIVSAIALAIALALKSPLEYFLTGLFDFLVAILKIFLQQAVDQLARLFDSQVVAILKIFLQQVVDYLTRLFDSQVVTIIIVATVQFGLIWLNFYEAGGNALIKHLALRLVLAWNRYAPLRYDLLLNYCTERLLLQRIGGRYRFMHKLLQDHFAKMDLE